MPLLPFFLSGFMIVIFQLVYRLTGQPVNASIILSSSYVNRLLRFFTLFELFIVQIKKNTKIAPSYYQHKNKILLISSRCSARLIWSYSYNLLIHSKINAYLFLFFPILSYLFLSFLIFLDKLNYLSDYFIERAFSFFSILQTPFFF